MCESTALLTGMLVFFDSVVVFVFMVDPVAVFVMVVDSVVDAVGSLGFEADFVLRALEGKILILLEPIRLAMMLRW